MILDRETIKELLAAGSVEVLLDRSPNTEKTYSVQPAVGITAVATARYTDYWPHRNGGYVVVLTLVRRVKGGGQNRRPRVRHDNVRLLKPRRGTTSDPRSAMRNPDSERKEDTTGVPHPDLTNSEPELVDEETERIFAHRAHQSDELRLLENQRRTLTERLDRTLEGAERLGVDPSRHLAAIERRISDLEKKLKKAA